MTRYDHSKIEKKWQKEWEKKKIYKTGDSIEKPKFYILDMFPYPSGEGLHVGHPKGYIATDIVSRQKRMQGFNVLHPMGFDAFGLPAENYAIKTKTNPSIAVAKNVERYKKQLEILGFDYDWSREVNTTDPKFYKWTQWIFLKLLEKGLAYESFEPINWCPSCKTGLANEDVEDGKCERCGTAVEKKPMRQWVLNITKYADRLLTDLDALNWPESIKEAQRNWIGRSEGVELTFAFKGRNEKLKVFTTRPDTLFGVTYLVIAPEHSFVTEILKKKESLKNHSEVIAYVAHARAMTEIERTDAKKDKSGVRLEGVFAINPANNEEVPVFVADYVLAEYGTGAVMAVPAHDERDFQFAQKFNQNIRRVISPSEKSESADKDQCYTGSGQLVDSGKFSGMNSIDAQKKITDSVGGNWVVKYKLKDWVFSRQRYWGEPFPILRGLKAKKALLIHGFEGNGNGHWFKKLKKALEDRGVEVFNPTISTSFHPTVESWMKELEPHVKDFGPDDIIVGHSLGSNAALRLIEKTGINIGNLFLIASAIGKPRDEKHWKIVEEMDGSESDVPALRKFWEAPINYNKVSKLVNKVTLVRSKDDVVIPSDTHEDLPSSWNIEAWDGFGHFDSKNGKEFDVLWKKIESEVAYEIIPVADEDLPVVLPKVKSYEPTGTGESPLASIEKWVDVKIGKGKSAKIVKRETNTMPQWAGSSWYYLRYMDPANSKSLVDPKKEKYWNQVDFYVGGAEHATRHLIYARFWHKFLYDIGVVTTLEPFKKLQSVGLIMGEDGRKMSKRFGNVVNPDEIAHTYGADTMRVYEMFMGPFDQAIAWSTSSIMGSRRFLERVWKLSEKVKNGAVMPKAAEIALNKTIVKVTEDIASLRHNTAISALMILSNEMDSCAEISDTAYASLLKMLAPFAPHMTEELWRNLGNKTSIHLSAWPTADMTKTVDDHVKIVVQVNGKMRASFEAPREATKDELQALALKLDEIIKWVGDKKPQKIIVVPGKLVSIVTD